MIRSKFFLASLFTILLLFYGCSYQPDRAFYYWKSVFSLSQLEKNYLREINITHLYVKFFDIDIDESTNKPVPIASIQFTENIPDQFEITPVVYIVNRTLLKTKHEDITDLANKILAQTNHLASKNNIHFNELQLDCDWTEKTKVNYFILLETLKQQLTASKITLSTTIRLHQIKYKNITGVPPVDRGMLMYYNTGKISSKAVSNSIFSPSDAAKYINSISDYPLKLDIVLPAFSWGIHIRNGNVIELLNNMNQDDFKKNNKFTHVDSLTLTANDSFFFRGFYFVVNDSVKIEEITPEQCLVAANQISNKLSKSTGRVAIFHLDSVILSRYEKKDFENIFNAFN